MSTASPASERVVLVVEDEPVLRASVVRGLFKIGDIEVMDAGTVREAETLIAAQPPDMVISDLDLPDGSGIEVAAELDRRGLRVPIVFVSAYVRSFQPRLPRRADIDVFEKPVSLARLRKLVVERLGGAARKEDTPSPFGVADYVQLAGLGQRSLVIEVRSRAGGGRIVIVGGEVWSAIDDEGEGVDAFRRLVFLPNASVACQRFDPHADIQRNVEGKAESLLLDAARLFDEAGGSSEQAFDSGWEAEASSSRPSSEASSEPLSRQASSEASASSAHLAAAAEVSPPTRRSAGVRAALPTPRSAPPSAVASATPAHPPPSEARIASTTVGAFAEAYDRAVELLLDKKYAEAFSAFEDAERLTPGDSRVVANLGRLRQMGYGK